ncbi:MAG: hypothetical protein ACHQ53_09050 [Polyangiales bacterium]
MTKLASARFLARSVLVCAGLVVGSVGCKTAQNNNTGGAGGTLSSFPTGTGTSSQLPATGSGGGSSIVSGGSGGVAAGTGGVAAGTGGVAAGTGGVAAGTGGVGTGGVGTGGVGTGGVGTGGMGTGGMGTGGMGTAGGSAGMGATDPCTMGAVAKMVPMACAACACMNKPTEAMACSADAMCWALIACIRDMCMGDSTNTSCILSSCSASVGSATPAMGIGPTLTGACMTQCAASH